MRITSGYVKKALIRDDGPIGAPMPMFLRCVCGDKVAVPNPFTDEEVMCTCCERRFDSRGYIVSQTEPIVKAEVRL